MRRAGGPPRSRRGAAAAWHSVRRERQHRRGRHADHRSFPAFSYVPSRSAQSVQRLLQAGAICLGKTNLDQFATGLSGARSPYGACSSVGNPLYVSGGSSSGSAVAVAAGHVSFALGTDTGGSGRIPAGFNGVVGVKPTVGRVSARGLVPNCPSLDCVSVFALSVEDGARVLDVLEGYDDEDPFSRRPPSRAAMLTSRSFRFGVLAEKDRDWCGMPECAALYEAACARLVRIGGTPGEIDFAPFREAGRCCSTGPGSRSDARRSRTSSRAIATPARRHALVLETARPRCRVRIRRPASLGPSAPPVDNSSPRSPRSSCRRRRARSRSPRCTPIRSASTIGSGTIRISPICWTVCNLRPGGVLAYGVPMGVTLLAPAWNDERLAAIARQAGGGSCQA